jgi:formate--tetrahydrofolate ligase
MTVLLKGAIKPNLVQTLESNPAFIHGGPFANIAHGCNSVIATKAALKLADYVVTEAGFGADLGAEKFFDIKCRKAGLSPSCVVLVATVRALKMNGGIGKDELGVENLAAIQQGSVNLLRHLENLAKFGVPSIVAINHFVTDTPAEIELVKNIVQKVGVEAVECRHWADGSKGAEELAHKVVDTCDNGQANFTPLYPDSMPLIEKINKVATEIYRADEIVADKKILNQLAEWEEAGYGNLPVCMAKTQYSFSADPSLRGAPTGHSLPIREVRLSAGAGFIVAICGDIMTMPGLPRKPAAEMIGISETGQVEGLF